MIQGIGNSRPLGIFISGFAQGDDLKTNYALSGYKQHLLEELCRTNNLQYNSFYNTCLIKNEEKFNEDGDEAYIEQQVEKYSPILIQELKDIYTELLIPLDEISFNFVTGLKGIRKFRGSVLLADPILELGRNIKVLPILGPYPYIQQEYEMKFISRIDFGKIKKNADAGMPPDHFTNCWVARNPSALREFLNRSYTDEGILNFDIETFMGIPTCISFCFDGLESVCVPLLDKDIDIESRALMLNMVAKLLNSPIRKINQNIKYDWKILERWGMKVNNIYGDSQIASSVLLAEFRKNLGFLTSLYTEFPYFKDEGKEWDPSKYAKEKFYMYNAKDSLAAWRIHTEQEKELEEQGATEIYRRLIHSLTIYKKVEDRGIRVDEVERLNFLSKYESLYRIETLKLADLTNRKEINPLSSVVANRVIFDDCGYDPKQRGVNNSTGEDQVMLMLAYGQAKKSPVNGPLILQCYINCRKIHKSIEVLEMPLYPDGRLRGEFNLGGTENGRTSCSGSLDQLVYVENGKIQVTKLGHSLQTIAKHGFQINGVTYGQEIRRIFVSSQGYEFVEIDLSQAEARVDTILASNFELLKVFDSKIGIHRLTGSWVYGCAPEDIRKNILVDGFDRYHNAKQVRHAGERNIGPQGLYALTQLPVRECTKLLKTFHEYQPEIRHVFHKEVEDAINSTRRLACPNGRFRLFFGRMDKNTFNEAISFLPQAIVSDQTKFAMAEAADICNFAYPLVENHDGTLWECPIGRRQELLSVYKRLVERPIDFRKCSLSRDFELIIPCEAEVGENWYDLKGVEIE